MKDLKSELHALYRDDSKHSSYQNVPDFVAREFGYRERIDEGWRGDRPRLALLRSTRSPVAGETWLDFGANTGFFVLSLANEFPETHFVAVEANPNHARFMDLVVGHFGMQNVRVVHEAIGLRELHRLPRVNLMLHLNVLHHAGHDFDVDLVSGLAEFPGYAVSYLRALRERADEIFFQIGSNWGGDKSYPLVGVREDLSKLRLFTQWLHDAGWNSGSVAYPCKGPEGRVCYEVMAAASALCFGSDSVEKWGGLDWDNLDEFPGEFYRRPLFHCWHSRDGEGGARVAV